MTQSEKICNDLAEKCFSKDYVFENLYYFNDENNKVELCDGLFEYSGCYVALQVKERSHKTKGNKSDFEWLNDTVYKDAVSQILETINSIKSYDIQVNDKYHQKVELHKEYLVFPIIVFDNNEVSKYKKVIEIEDCLINVLSIIDFESMLSVLIHPYDIIYYLQERTNWINGSDFPNLALGESKKTSVMARINNEKDFSQFFLHLVYDGEINKQEDAIHLLSIISLFRSRQIKKNPNYKQILNILQRIEPSNAFQFMNRFNYVREESYKNKCDFTKCMQLSIGEKTTDIVFFSVGNKPFTSYSVYQVICDAKQLQHKSDAVLLISVITKDKHSCLIDWFYYEKEYLEEKALFKSYENMGMYNGSVTREELEELGRILDSIPSKNSV